MSEFDKWFSKLDDIQLTRFTKQNRAIAKNAWRTALRWAKATHDVVSEPRFSCIIREELSDE